MSKEVAENALINMERSFFSSISSSFNNFLINWGISKNNNTYFITNFNNDLDEQPTIVKKEDLPAVEEEIFPIVSSNYEDQNALIIEVFPNDQKIIELIWKYLSIDDKLNFTLVCRGFNRIVSVMDCFCLSYSPSLLRIVPKLSRNYKKAILRGMKCSDLKRIEKIMFKQLSRSVTNLTVCRSSANLKELCELLNEFVLLESLDLNICLEDIVELSIADLPDFLQLKFLKIDFSAENLNETLAIFDSAPIIESLSLFKVKLTIKELNYFLKEHKNYLKSLTFNYCTLYSDFKYSKGYLTQKDFNTFDDLLHLRELHLIDNSLATLGILKTKCINWLTDLEVFYRSSEKKIMESFVVNYLLLKEIDEVQLSEYDASKGPIIVKSKCPISEKIKTKLYHIHHCALNVSSNSHNDCVAIPIPYKDFNYKDEVDEFLFISVQIRNELRDFNKLKEVGRHWI